jgi:phosphotransferase family enzyme
MSRESPPVRGHESNAARMSRETLTPPAAAGVRLPWAAAPGALRTAVEARLGAPVVRAVTQVGGFSPGVAARVELADGRRAFVKAVGPEPNPDSAGMHRSEARIAAALPAAAPVPRLLADVEVDGWVALAYEDIDGHTPVQPWRPTDLDRVLTALGDLDAALTGSAGPPAGAPPAAEACADMFGAWRGLSEPERVGGWVADHIEEIVGWEERWEAAVAGTALLHGDLRADNILLTPERVVFVDWPSAMVGAAWVDVVLMAPSVIMHDGEWAIAPIEAHLARHRADPDDVTAVLAAVTGFFACGGLLPPPPGLPTLREFQRAQAHAGLRWLRRRLG